MKLSELRTAMEHRVSDIKTEIGTHEFALVALRTELAEAETGLRALSPQAVPVHDTPAHTFRPSITNGDRKRIRSPFSVKFGVGTLRRWAIDVFIGNGNQPMTRSTITRAIVAAHPECGSYIRRQEVGHSLRGGSKDKPHSRHVFDVVQEGSDRYGETATYRLTSNAYEQEMDLRTSPVRAANSAGAA